MPLFYQHNINHETKLGVWKIEEDSSFFLNKVPLQQEISHPHKRLQHLAGRYLLQYLFPDFPYSLIQIAETRKPFLSNEAYHFSISHCGDYAAGIVSRVNRVGVDIELVKPMIEKLKFKFLNETEIRLIASGELSLDKSNHTPGSGDLELLTLCWCAKEAMFKWFGDGAVDFRKHMEINTIEHRLVRSVIQCSFKRDRLQELSLEYHQFDGAVLTWVVT